MTGDACSGELAKVDTSGHILFGTDSAKLEPSSFDRSIGSLGGAVLHGHAHRRSGATPIPKGAARYNQRLSVRRARAVQPISCRPA